MIPVELTRILPEQASVLASLARSIYRQHYLHLWESGGANWYMYEQAYAIPLLQSELSDLQQPCWFVVYRQRRIGYLKLSIKEDGLLELERIYLYSDMAGTGIGTQLIRFTEEQAKQYHCKKIELKAMDSSTDAIRFYQREGFVISGTYQLPFPLMKPAYRGMVILSKEI
jgi:GNAT superfamily N-acetyltransferase